jgi:hypothetical protein
MNKIFEAAQEICTFMAELKEAPEILERARAILEARE